MNLEFSSGGAIYKKIGDKIFWLITLSSPSQAYPKTIWRLPKGWLDDEDNDPGPLARGERKANEEDLRKAAMREVAEEAGVKTEIIKKIGTQKVFFSKSGDKYIKFITFYLMEWKKDIPEGPGFETSKIEWLPLDVALDKLKHKSEKEVLLKAKEILDKGIQNNLL